MPRTGQTKKDRFGSFLYGIFGPATVEGAIQGWSPQARDQYRQMRANQKLAAEQRRGQAGHTERA